MRFGSSTYKGGYASAEIFLKIITALDSFEINTKTVKFNLKSLITIIVIIIIIIFKLKLSEYIM